VRQAFARVSSSRIWSWLWSWLRVDTPKQPFITDPRARIFLVSFAMLFFELLCIRWIPSYVRYLSYFNNFILMASFLGIGLGMLSARRKNFWFLPFPLLVLIMVIVVRFRLCHALDRFSICPQEKERVTDKYHQEEGSFQLGHRTQKEQHHGKSRDERRDHGLSSHASVDHHGEEQCRKTQGSSDNGDVGANDIAHGQGWSATPRSKSRGEHLLWFQAR